MSAPAILTVPRRPFLGWFASVASFDAAGIGRVLLTFDKGKLHLKSDWGETRMSYEGDFEGKVDISARSLVMLVKRYYRQADAPTPVTLCLETKPGKLSMDARSVPCVVTPFNSPKLAELKPEPLVAVAGRFLFAMSHASLKALMRKLFANVPRKEAVLCLSVARGTVNVRCGAKLGTTTAETFGEGRVSFRAAPFYKVLSTYDGEPRLEVEGSPTGLRINSFKMPVLDWNHVPETR